MNTWKKLVLKTLACSIVILALPFACFFFPLSFDVIGMVRFLGLAVVCGFLLRIGRIAGLVHQCIASCIVFFVLVVWALCTENFFGIVSLLRDMGEMLVCLVVPSTIGMVVGMLFLRWFNSVRAKRIGLIVAVVIAVFACNVPLVVNFCQRLFYLESTPAAPHRDAKDLTRTVVVPTLDAPLCPNTNVIWCATAQLAWNELMTMAGGSVEGTTSTAVFDALNRQDVTKDHVDRSTCVAVAERGANAAQLIRKRLESEGWDSAEKMGYRNPSMPIAGDGIVAFSSLRCNFEFAWVFERIKKPLRFNDSEVKSFGIDAYSTQNSQQRRCANQVVVWENTNTPMRADCFIIELKTKQPDHHLIIAHVQPRNSLAETVDAVSASIAHSIPDSMGENCRLAVPIINFDVLRQYTELLGNNLRNRKTQQPLGPLVQFDQQIRVRLDERGFSLSSWSLLVAACIGQNLVVDGPFLLMARYKDSPKPYFAAWIANEELLEPVQTQSAPKKQR